jgi:hypothetical protein
MVVKLGVNRLEARIPSANPIIESSSGTYNYSSILKPQRSRFHPKQNTVNGIIINMLHFTIQIFFRVRPKNYIFIYWNIIILKALNTLPLLTYQHSNYLRRQQSNVLHPKSISAA